MARRIPPLNPLRVFEVVARTRNLTAASKELHVSQSAVSRQVAALESYLGLDLFRRERHGVELTPMGQAYAQKVVPAFAAIAIATEELLKERPKDGVRVRTYATFAARWLIPRLAEFNRLHPGIDVFITTAVPDVDFMRDAADVAIQFGNGHWPGISADLLFGDEIAPVCSPAYLRDRGAHAAALLQGPLLISRYRRADGSDWLQEFDQDGAAKGARKMTFNSSVLTWQAALEGLGIAMGQIALLQGELAAGRLVRPLHGSLQRKLGHYIVRPKGQRASANTEAFQRWVIATALADPV